MNIHIVCVRGGGGGGGGGMHNFFSYNVADRNLKGNSVCC